MFKHIVMWKLKEEAEGATKIENAAKVKEVLEALNGVIKEIRELEVGIDISLTDSSFDIALYSVFDSKEDCATYAAHPEHQKIVSFIKKIVTDRIVVDYEM